MRPAINIAGQQFGRWTVISRDCSVEPRAGKHARWIARCECGAERSVSGSVLRTLHSQSCGCLAAELVAERNTVHGHYGSPTYEVWHGIIQRCCNPNHHGARYYSERGIAICDRWRHSFDNFLADMGEKPPGLTIDRINNNGNYEPGNCRWTTWEVQNANRRPRSEWVNA